jgi:DNA polymerase-3 subunit beta
MPSLNHALFECKDSALQISATDLEIFVTSSVSCKALTTGRLAVPARSLFDIVKELPDSHDIHIRSLDGNKLEVVSGKSQFKLLGLSSDSFPHFKASPKGQLTTAKLKTKSFLKLLQKVEHSVCLEEIRYFLTGIYLESVSEDGQQKLKSVATDGHRLSTLEIPNSEMGDLSLKKGMIIPKKGVTELRKLLESCLEESFEITCDENLFRAHSEGFHLWIRPIDGEYPDYKRVIPSQLSSCAKVSKRDLLTALRRMALLVSDRSKVVTFEFKKDLLVLSTVNPDLGEASDEVAIEYSGSELKTGFNVRFYIDALSHLDSDQIEIWVGEKLQPAILKSSANPGYVNVIMPMRI